MNKENQKIFAAELMKLVGHELECKDGSGVGSFMLTEDLVDGIAHNLATWWSEEEDGEIELTPEYAADYINKTYPISV